MLEAASSAERCESSATEVYSRPRCRSCRFGCRLPIDSAGNFCNGILINETVDVFQPLGADWGRGQFADTHFPVAVPPKSPAELYDCEV